MGKDHADNHRARVKRGKIAFTKKAERRKPESKCNLCGNKCRVHKLISGLCPNCIGKGAL